MMWGAGECVGWGTTGGVGGSGMMLGNARVGAAERCPMAGGAASSLSVRAIELSEAQEAVEAYVYNQGYDDLEIAEVMEFERNFYAIVREVDTGIGAMELLVDKTTGAVGPEVGPNMMWNARYGMHGRTGMMGRSSDENTVSAERAVEIAQRWLDANQPGVDAEEHADPFYGYYTIHTVRGGEIDGMLSVHGTTGQVWCHSWHGDFVRMVEGEAEHD